MLSVMTAKEPCPSSGGAHQVSWTKNKAWVLREDGTPGPREEIYRNLLAMMATAPTAAVGSTAAWSRSAAAAGR